MVQENHNRKLTALLSADVVGYSRMMGSNEAATLEALTANKAIMAERILQCCGRVVDSPGDNLLAEFSSALAAVNCAVSIQKELKDKNSSLPEEQQMTYRIGVNLGEVIEEEGQLYGDCVNITARLQTLASPGSIFISGFVFDQVVGKQPFAYDYLGKKSFKNIEKPVRVYRLVENSDRPIKPKQKTEKRSRVGVARRFALIAAVPILALALAFMGWQEGWKSFLHTMISTESDLHAVAELPAIAVLPFENLSQTAEYDDFTDALTDDIITNLSQLSRLSVIARNSVFTYKGKPTKTQVLAKELDAQYVLEGSLRRVGNQILINAQLIDAASGHHMWAQRYDLEVKDLFAVQIDITTKISAALNLALSDQDRAVLQEKGSAYLDAYMKKLDAGEQKLQPKEKDLKPEMIFWESIKDSGQAAMYEEYLRQFPEGIFAGLARLNILKPVAPKASPPAKSQLQQVSKTAEKTDALNKKTPIAGNKQTQKTEIGLSEEALWRSIQGTTKIEDYETFLNKFPNGLFAGLAWIKIDALSKPPVPPADNKIEFAIFSAKFDSYTASGSQLFRIHELNEVIAKGLLLALRQQQSFVPKWSSYKLGKDYDIKPPDYGIPKSINIDTIWLKQASSGSEVPNIDVIRQINQSIHVDAVLMFRTYEYSASFVRNHFFLVDVASGRVFSETFDSSRYNDNFGPTDVRDIILRLFNKIKQP